MKTKFINASAVRRFLKRSKDDQTLLNKLDDIIQANLQMEKSGDVTTLEATESDQNH